LWTGSPSAGFKSWLELHLNRRQLRFFEFAGQFSWRARVIISRKRQYQDIAPTGVSGRCRPKEINELGVITEAGGFVKIELPIVTVRGGAKAKAELNAGAIQPSIAANEPEKPQSSVQSVIMGTDGKSSETILQGGSADLAFNHQEVTKK